MAEVCHCPSWPVEKRPPEPLHSTTDYSSPTPDWEMRKQEQQRQARASGLPRRAHSGEAAYPETSDDLAVPRRSGPKPIRQKLRVI